MLHKEMPPKTRGIVVQRGVFTFTNRKCCNYRSK